jgi:hypothetical protein
MQAQCPALSSVNFPSGSRQRRRSISTQILHGTVDVPALPRHLVADSEREVLGRLGLEPGDVQALSLPRARMRWPEHRHWLQAAKLLAHTMGLSDLLAQCDLALMACRGAPVHHDAAQYGGFAFCNLFLSDDLGLDLRFPAIQHRIPLTRGSMVIFDTAQPHTVLPRGASHFHAADFAPAQNKPLLFLSWELPIEAPAVTSALGIAFDGQIGNLP